MENTAKNGTSGQDKGYPASVAAYAGRMMDVDSHEWHHVDLWLEAFGKVAAPLIEYERASLTGYKNKDHGLWRNVLTEKTDELNIEAVWHTKGPYATGAYDMRRRVDVLDYIGVRRQLVFPGGLALVGAYLIGQADDPSFFPAITGDRRAVAMQMMDGYNDWVVRQTRISDRVRPVASLVAETPDEIYEKAKRLIGQGVRAFWLPSSILPGGKSPAHNDLDRLWALCADSNTVLTLHVGNELHFYKTLEWKNAAAFENWPIGNEINMDPWSISTFSVPSQNFLTTMVVGGVFLRHPKLRLGVIETGAYWLGPLAKSLDMWAEHTSSQKWKDRLKEKPSEFIRRNVRVSGFPFEPIDEYIAAWGFEDVFCYASDFPHAEGGKDPMGGWAKGLERLGKEVQEKFYVTNGAWLLPD